MISQKRLIKLGIIFKLKQNCISGKLLSVLPDFLKDREQRFTLNGQVSSSAGVNAGVLRDQFWVLFFIWFISTI